LSYMQTNFAMFFYIHIFFILMSLDTIQPNIFSYNVNPTYITLCLNICTRITMFSFDLFNITFLIYVKMCVT